MRIEDILSKIIYYGKQILKVIIGGIILLAEVFWKFFSSLHIGDRISKFIEKYGIKLSGKTIDKIICIILCVVLAISIFSTSTSTKSGGSSSIWKEDCWACRGSGDCGECGGDGRKLEWMGDQYMDVRCTSCIGGNCNWCNGSGKK